MSDADFPLTSGKSVNSNFRRYQSAKKAMKNLLVEKVYSVNLLTSTFYNSSVTETMTNLLAAWKFNKQWLQ